MKIISNANKIVNKHCYFDVKRNFSGILSYTPSTTWPQHCFVLTSSTSLSHKSIFNTIFNNTCATVHVATRSCQTPHLLLHTYTHTCLPRCMYISIISQFILFYPCTNNLLFTYTILSTYFQPRTYATK